MKITHAPNPLRTTVELDESDRAMLRLKIKVEELIERISSAHFALDPESRTWLARINKGLTLEESVTRVLETLDISYVLGDTKHGDRSFDDYIDEQLAYYVEALMDAHCGDCTCVPSSCTKCHAEGLVGINTCPGLKKHEARFIESAFRSGAGDREASIDEAIAYLRDYRPKRTPVWGHYNDEQWATLADRWSAEARRAHDWLVAYREMPELKILSSRPQ